MKSPVPGYILCGVGLALVVVGLVWAKVVGFYQSQLPMLIGILAIGAALTWVGQRMFQSAKRGQVEQRIAERRAGER